MPGEQSEYSHAGSDTEYPGKELEAMSFAANYHRWILEEFTPFLGETVVEVGAGAGDFSCLLLETSVQKLFSFEPSSNLYPLLKAKLSNQDRFTPINDFLRPNFTVDEIDSVLYVNVLEHIERDREELRTAREILRPGGHLLLFVPALRWLYSEADKQMGHFRRYHLTALRERVTESGLEVLKCRYFDIAGIVPWYINFVLLRNPLTAGSVNVYDKIVVPPMKFLERYVRPPIGKNILLIARK